MTDLAFSHIATVTASTKRNALVNGERSGYVTNLASLNIVPLCPIESQRAADIKSLLKLDAGYRLLETFAQDNPDIHDGDILVVEGREYHIRSALRWRFGTDTRLNLILEEVKR